MGSESHVGTVGNLGLGTWGMQAAALDAQTMHGASIFKADSLTEHLAVYHNQWMFALRAMPWHVGNTGFG